MTTHRQDADLSPWGLLWGVFWRSVLWYTVAGAVLGGIYGCVLVAVAMFSADAGEAIEPSEVWAPRALIGLLGVTGFAGGWALARAIGREMRPVLGAAIGSMAGVQLGGLQYLFAYFIAFPFGAIFGGAYGLEVGFVNASLVAALTRALSFPLSEPRLYRRAVKWTSLLGVLLAAGFRLYQTRTILTFVPSREAILSRDGERAAVLAPGEFTVYSIPEGRRLHALPLGREEAYDLDSAVWASNGRFLATSGGWRVHVYDAAEEAEIAQLPVEAAAQLAWSPDGSLLAVSTLEGTDNPFAAESEARIWSRDSRSWTHTLPVGEVWSDAEDSTLAVAFFTDGRHIASHGSDETVRIWPVREES